MNLETSSAGYLLSHSSAGPDFRALNKKALLHGLCTSQGQREFREAHSDTLLRQTVRLSTSAPKQIRDLVHGRPSKFLTAEEIRTSGKYAASTDMTALLQNGFADEWVKKQCLREAPPGRPIDVRVAPTKASEGHELGAMETMVRRQAEHQGTGHLFKMPRFRSIGPKVSVGRPAVPS